MQTVHSNIKDEISNNQLTNAIQEAYNKYKLPTVENVRSSAEAPEFNMSKNNITLNTIGLATERIRVRGDIIQVDMKINKAYSLNDQEIVWKATTLNQQFKNILSISRKAIRRLKRPGVSWAQDTPLVVVELKSGLRLIVQEPRYAHSAIKDHYIKYGHPIEDNAWVVDCPTLAIRGTMAIPVEDIKAVHFIVSRTLDDYKRTHFCKKEDILKIFSADGTFESNMDKI